MLDNKFKFWISCLLILFAPAAVNAYDSSYAGAAVDAEVARSAGRNTTVADPGSDAELVTEQAVREALDLKSGIPENAIIVAASGGDYTDLSDAVDAASAGDTVLVYPGTYTDTITVAVNNLSIVSMGNPSNTILTQADANVVDFGATTGGRIVGFKILLSAPTTAIAAVTGSTGQFSVLMCQSVMTCTANLSQANQPMVGQISGAGVLNFNLGKVTYTHSGTTSTGIKAPFSAGTGGRINVYNIETLDINGSGSSNVTGSAVVAGTGYVIFESCNIDVDDDTSTSTVGIGYIGSATSVDTEFFGNIVHVHAANNTAYGAFALLGSFRSAQNHYHVECSGTGDAYSFVESGAGEIQSHLDDIIATEGYTGNIVMASSEVDGDLTVTGDITINGSTTGTLLDAKEDSLGNPGSNDYVLASQTDGTRSWVANSGGAVSDTAYGAGWEDDTTTAASKNALFDKFDSIAGGTMTYPGEGIPLSTGSAWDTSYSIATLGAALEGDMILSNMQGAVTDGQVPNDITITGLSGTNTGDNTVATSGDTATSFFSTGTVEDARIVSTIARDTELHDASTIGTANGLSLSGQEISLSAATNSAAGAATAAHITKIEANDSDAKILARIIDEAWTPTGAWDFGSVSSLSMGPQTYTSTASLPSSDGQFRYNSGLTGITGKHFSWYDTAVRYNLGILALPTVGGEFPMYDAGTDEIIYNAMSGDATMDEDGVVTFDTVNSNVGAFTNADITVNAKGLITAASSGSSSSETNSLETTITGIADTEIFIGDGADSGTFKVISGDISLANTGATTLDTVNSNVGSFTNASITVNGKGLITAASTGSGASVSAYESGTECDFYGTILNPEGVYDNDSTNHALTFAVNTPAAFTITAIYISCDADPTTEPTLTFKHKAAGVGYGTPTTIEAVTTTAGVASITTGIDDATIPANTKLFITLSDPDTDLNEITWQIKGDWD